jgi:branched-subunit amino acid transport protein
VGITRVEIILIMGLMAYGARALPQLYLVGRKFPEAWERLLRYLSYALICSIVSITLFMTAGRFESEAAPHRAAALIATLFIAHWTKSAVTAMVVGTAIVLLFSWLR